jgi:hypothetical protein
LDSRIDLFGGTEEQHASSDCNDVTESQNPKLAILAIHSSPIGALQISKHQVIVVFLDLAVKAADTLVVKLDRVPFFATDRDWGFEVCVNSSTICTLDDTER